MAQRSSEHLRRLGAFLLLGIAVGTGVRYYIERRARERRNAPLQPLIDWNQARIIALKVAQSEKVPLPNRAFRQSQYQRMVGQSEQLISQYLGVSLPEPIRRVYVLDRQEWLEANFASFERLFAPIEAIYQDRIGNTNPLKVLFGPLNSQIFGAQIGGVLGFMARRVLGQYDMSLLSPQPEEQGALYYVEPNIALIQHNLGLHEEEFRMWITLHETTHVFEFEAYPWVRAHFNALIQQYFDQLGEQLEGLGKGLPRLIARLVQHVQQGGHWVELLLSPAQRNIFEQLQAMMTLAEGYSNHLMNAIGRQILPSFSQIEQRMEQRQQARTIFDHLFYRLTGLDLKMEQYKKGEAFVNEVVRRRGIAFAARAWERAAYLPTLHEINNPGAWIDRMTQHTHR